MFCLPGMTTYRALFDVLGIPYVGNPPDVMALGADKAKARAVVAAAGVAVPGGRGAPRGRAPAADPAGRRQTGGRRQLARCHAGPQPRGVRRGVGRRRSRIPTGCWWSSTSSWAGRSAAASLVRDGELICLPLEEYNVDPSRPSDGTPTRSRGPTAASWSWSPRTPRGRGSSIPPTRSRRRCGRRRGRCHEALGCRHYSLFDFRIDPAGRPWFLEAGLYCSFARKSVVAMMAEAAGIPLGELFATAVQQAARGRATLGRRRVRRVPEGDGQFAEAAQHEAVAVVPAQGRGRDGQPHRREPVEQGRGTRSGPPAGPAGRRGSGGCRGRRPGGCCRRG